MQRVGYVYFNNVYCGKITEDDFYTFEYDENYKGQSISLLLPIEKHKFISNELFPFFDNLIPEGYILSQLVKNYDVSLTDRFGLLLLVCKDCIGAVGVSNKYE